jgi:hypothetical protein
MRTCTFALLMALAVALACPIAPASAALVPQSDDSKGPPLPEEATHFDFWIGTWQVGPTAIDKVKRFGKGVAILETYTNGANKGWSVNTFDLKTKTWTQTWYLTAGGFFQLTGKKEGNRIVLVGETTHPQTGEVALMRLSFINITPDSFDQLYEASTDGGKTWKTTSTVPFRRIK